MWSRVHHSTGQLANAYSNSHSITPHMHTISLLQYPKRGVFKMAPLAIHHHPPFGCGRHARQHPHAAASYDGSIDGPSDADILKMDSNQLQTALNVAIASEDYALAAVLRDALTRLMGENPKPADWQQMGVLDWLAERAERLGFRYPTGVCVPGGVEVW